MVAVNNIVVFNDSTGATVKDGGQPITAVQLFNGTSTKTTPYTIVQGDKQQTIVLGGNAFYSVTLPDPTQPPFSNANFNLILYNSDTGLTGRAKYIVVTGGTSFYLWPGQSVLVYNPNTSWQFVGQRRWKVPGGNLTVNVDPLNGSDTFGAADGLGTGSGAFASLNHALYITNDQFDYSGYDGGQTVVTVTLAAGQTDTVPIHFAPHSRVGAQGGGSLVINLNGGTLSTPTTGLAVFFNMALQVRNGTIKAPTAGACISATLGGKVEVMDGMTFGPIAANGNIFTASDGGRIQFNNNFTVSGAITSGYVFVVADGGRFDDGGAITCSFTGGQNFTALLTGSSGGIWAAADISFSAPANTVTGILYQLTKCTFYDPLQHFLNFLGTQTGITNGQNNAWTSFAPALTPGSGAFTSASATGAYRIDGNTMFIQVKIIITTVGTAGTSLSVASPPIAGQPGGPLLDCILTGQDNGFGGVTALCSVGSNNFLLTSATGSLTSFMASGHTINLSGAIQIPGQ